jgi:hypothetical protein
MLTNAARIALVLIAAICAALGIVGCATGPDTTPDAGMTADAGLVCPAIAPTDVTSYGDCKAQKDGVACATSCGRLPDDGGLGTAIPAGCQISVTVENKTTTYVCVDSCAECAQ